MRRTSPTIALDPADGPSAVARGFLRNKNLIYQHLRALSTMVSWTSRQRCFAAAKIGRRGSRQERYRYRVGRRVLSPTGLHTSPVPGRRQSLTPSIWTSNVVAVIEAGATCASATSVCAVVFQSLP